jgi:uncharacterized protein
MPVAPTYPGVYIQEVPSGVRTITGVATSVTAFLGRAYKGPLNTAVLLNSYADYERVFGGMTLSSPMSYAVRDFFVNGGAKAKVVRLFHDDDANAANNTAIATITIGGSTITLLAASPGLWGRNLRARFDGNVKAAAATALGVAVGDVFNLTLSDAETGAVEEHRNVTLVDSNRRIDRVLAADSMLARWGSPALPGTAGAFTYPPAGVGDAVSIAEAALAAAKKANLPTVPALEAALATARAAMGGSDGTFLTKAADFTPANAEANKVGLYALADHSFNILVIPPYTDPGPEAVAGNVETDLTAEAAAYCETRRAMIIVDPPTAWTTKALAQAGGNDLQGALGTLSANAAVFFPRIRQRNPLRENRLETASAAGAIAGIWARTDTQRGVWKAPAGLEATLVGVPDLVVNLTDGENGDLNPLGINCLRLMPAGGRIVWGARTLRGDDRLASEWKYIPVRRTALFIEESLYHGTKWVVFEPNDEPLWAQIRLNVGAFMQSLFLQGAFQGTSPKEAYLVKCDKETTTQDDINRGVVNIVVGFAPLKPAEFVIIKIQQLAGQVAA